jgi:hypothetical protein
MVARAKDTGHHPSVLLGDFLRLGLQRAAVDFDFFCALHDLGFDEEPPASSLIEKLTV